MPSAVASRRKEILAAARSSLADFVRLDPTRLRFSLGTTPGDPRIPVQVAPDARGIVRGAAADLGLLLSTTHRAFISSDDFDRLVMSEGYAGLPAPAQTLGPSTGGVDLRAAARLGAECHPALTGGILCSWMGPGGRGRSLTALWIEVMQASLAEMASEDVREETPIIAALALYGEMLAGADAARDWLPGPPADRYLRAAQGAGLWIAARTGIHRAWRQAGRPASDPLLLKLEAVVAPGPLLGRGGKLGGATLYGCELTAGLPRADEVVARLAAGGDPDAAEGDAAASLLADEDLSLRAGAAVAVGRLRELILAAVAAAESAGHGEGVKGLRQLYAAPQGLSGALAEDASRLSLRKACSAGEVIPGEAGQVLAEVARALKRFRLREPSAAFGLDREAACREYAACVAAMYCDAALERVLQPARRALALRTGQETESGAEAEWEAGRLYRISARRGPILRRVRHRPLGHLFADVKDFTRRTGLLGQATMAEFLRTEFYGPILSAGKRFYSGMSHLADKGGVALNNLLGDAMSFTGDIESLVGLASEVRRILADYGERLEREVSSDAVARQVADIEARHAEELARVRRGVAQARAAAGRAAPGSPAQAEALEKVTQLGAEEARLARERERALARARGEGLEAGVFISFGAAPMVVVIDDEVFGANRVAIADKINESARGTARAPMGRARADGELEAERAARRSPRLEHAWSVFIDHPLAVALPAAVEREALAAARAGDMPAALQAVAGPLRQALEEAAQGLGPEEPGELYNSGAALSQEALDAFLRAVRDARLVRETTLVPEALPEVLRARFFYGSQPQALVATFHLDGRPAELFRRVGRAAFKGLGTVPVWEICAGLGASLLVQTQGEAWLQSG
jgi:hypothetical protein